MRMNYLDFLQLLLFFLMKNINIKSAAVGSLYQVSNKN